MSQSLSNGRPLPRKIKIALILTAAAVAAFLLRQALSMLLFQAGLAALIAWAASPLCKRLEKRFSPGLSALLSLLFFLAAAALLLMLLIPRLAAQITQALSAVPQLLNILQQMLEKAAASPFFSHLAGALPPSNDLLKKAGDLMLSILPRLAQWLGRIANRLLRAFLAPALAFYFLRDRESFCFQLSLLIPLRWRKPALLALREMRHEVAGYFRGQLLVGFSVALLTALGLMIIGTPSALALGLMMGICDLIPYVGPYLGAIPIVLFSLPQGIYAVVWALVAVIVVQQTESLFLSPHFMSGATGLHPAYVLLLLSFGGLIGGLSGMLLSLPLFICLRSVVRSLQSIAPRNS